jgi:HlyD family secretion protein
LPDSNASRYNPSLKVYPATIEIDGMHDFLKPGMTAKVKIIVSELTDVIYVPVQSVFVEEDEHYVFVKKGSGYDPVPVKIGQHNEEFIQILEGLGKGQMVALKMPAFFENSPQETRKALARYSIESPKGVSPAKTVVASPGA